MTAQRWGVFYVSDMEAREHGHAPDVPLLGPFATEREAQSALYQLPSIGDEYDYGFEYTTDPWPEEDE